MRHPFDSCALRAFCCCCYFDPEVTCYIIAICCILINVYSGTTNYGVGHWSVYATSIVNLLVHLGAGTLLFMGTLWGNEGLKLAYCWILFFAVIVVILGLVAYCMTYKEDYLVYFDARGNKLGLIGVGLNTLWLLFWDIYSPMVVLGNTSVANDM